MVQLGEQLDQQHPNYSSVSDVLTTFERVGQFEIS